jgi:hypothetical protein
MRGLAELVDEDSETSGSVTKATSGLRTGKAINEKSAECFVLTVSGIGRFQVCVRNLIDVNLPRPEQRL